MKNSHISWTNHTFNPWIGCTKVSPGCTHCYAETRDERFHRGIHWGKGATRVRTSTHNWNDPVRWNKEAAASGIRPRVFCASLGDWLDDEIDIGWLADLLRLIRATPNLDWLLLTKRPQLWQNRLVRAKLHIQEAGGHDTHPDALWILDWLTGHPPANVWVGTTVEDQERGNERVPALLSIPAVIRFLSCEPLLGPVDLHKTDSGMGSDVYWHDHIHWVIVGGESGVNARPMDLEWACALRDQCIQAKVAFHFKQWGEWCPRSQIGLDHPKDFDQIVDGKLNQHDSQLMAFNTKIGKVIAGRRLFDRVWDEIPKVSV